MPEPSPGPPSLLASLPHAPGPLLMLPKLASSSPAQGQGKEEGRSSDLPSPTPQRAFMVTDKWRPGHWVEMTAYQRCGGRRGGAKARSWRVSHNHTIHWELGGRGMEAPSHSPNTKVKQTVNVNAGCHWPVTIPRSFSWEHQPYDL